jgi:hypothetical protein
MFPFRREKEQQQLSDSNSCSSSDDTSTKSETSPLMLQLITPPRITASAFASQESKNSNNHLLLPSLGTTTSHTNAESPDSSYHDIPDEEATTTTCTPTQSLMMMSPTATILSPTTNSSCPTPTTDTPSFLMDNNNNNNNRPPLPEELFLSVMDHMEDEWDDFTYLSQIPTEVRVSLEETFFGWDHLYSSVVGHVGYTVGAFFLAFGIGHYILPESWMWMRNLLSVIAAVSVFRMVRRRRRVWMKHVYGSQAYRQDYERRIKDVREADTGWLSRIRKKRQERSVAKQLKRAETQFERHHARQLKRAVSSPISCQTPSSSSPGALSPRLTPNARRKVRMCFRTDPVPIMESIQQDQIIFEHGPIERMPYSHGGFFAAAPFLLANPHWISVLRHLMPDVYVEISRRVGKAPMQKLIHWAENNPVVAAYGSAQELEYDGKIVNLEWDVFLDPALVQNVMRVLEQRDKFLASFGMSVSKPMDKIYLPGNMSDQDKGILKYYNKQLVKWSQELVDKMLIAHGNLTQLIIEQTGYLKHYNYSRVKRTRRTLGGGIYAKQWMAVYAESLRIGVTDVDWNNNSPERSPERDFQVLTMGPLDAGYAAIDSTIEEAVAVVKGIAQCNDPFGLVLDLKSRHVPKQVWACVVDTLRKAGVRVEGIGSFVSDDIRGLSRYSIKPVTEVLFFHSAGDLQVACHEGRVQSGDTVFFNAGSLLWTPSSRSYSETVYDACFSHFDSDSAKLSYRLLPFAQPTTRSGGSVSTIEHYKKQFNLSIGMYVQEFAIDDAAASLLSSHVNRHPQIYNLGLSWGGINGICIRGIQPDRISSTDGFWNQRYIGNVWNPYLFPPGWVHDADANAVGETTCSESDSDKAESSSWPAIDESSAFLKKRDSALT